MTDLVLSASEHKHLLENPHGLMVLLAYHDYQQDCADSMGAECHGNRDRYEQLKAHGRAIVLKDPEIWSDEVLRAFGVTPGVTGMGDCGNAECNWRGPLSECSHIGAVGPCCPKCREIVEPDASGVALPRDLGREVRDLVGQIEHAAQKLGNAQRASDREAMRQWRDVLNACKVELDTLLPPGVALPLEGKTK